ncbi:MAG: citramalate synthase [Devosiaceae bacterium]|nr:citramalate synthase [Devosiaceae bacterium MH13]
MNAHASKERLYLFDTTLRDGQQTTGIDFSLDDKITIARMLDELGVDYVEGGYPGANPTDSAFFEEPRTSNATFTAFGMTRRAGVSTSNDPGLRALLDAAGDAICFVAKSWDYHVRVALKTTEDENLACIQDCVMATLARGKEPMVDCEHFFDGYKANPGYALACAEIAYQAGARWVVLCDTNGGTQPDEVRAIVAEVIKKVPGSHLGIHPHNDTEQAVANALAAVRAGARQIQGTLNGIGERCGNANLTSIIPTLLLKEPYASQFEIGVSPEQLAKLTTTSRAFDEILNRAPDRHAPYVGAAAFATKAGIHASALLKEPETYEHVPPQTVGNRRRVLVSDQAGKSNLISELNRLGLVFDSKDPRLDDLLVELKQREATGYSYEGADASLALLAMGRLGTIPRYFKVDSYKVAVERRFNALGETIDLAEAVVKVEVDGEKLMSVAEGNGPVNALDNALRKDLGRFQSIIETLELVDYKVRILNAGTAAITRVLIESEDTATGDRWYTVGVSENIVDASFQALEDSIITKLMRAEGLLAVPAAE